MNRVPCKRALSAALTASTSYATVVVYHPVRFSDPCFTLTSIGTFSRCCRSAPRRQCKANAQGYTPVTPCFLVS